MAAFTSIAIGAGLLAGATFGASAYTAHHNRKAARRAAAHQENLQEKAKREAERRATKEAARRAREERKASQSTPEIAGLLGRERRASTSGAATTMLTGAGGIPSSQMTLGRSSLLGAT